MADETNYSVEQLKAAGRKAVSAGDFAAAKRYIDAAKAAESSRAPVRMAAQGATFGLSDEAIAAATNPISAVGSLIGRGGQEYETRLGQERAKLEAYRRDYPIESLAAEVGGAAVPAAVATIFTGGAAAPATAAPLMARLMQAAPTLMKQGAIYGAGYGFGTAEGGPLERLKGTASGAVGGAIAGPVAGAVTYPIVAGAKAVTDTARRLVGGRGGKAVEFELQRLAESTGLSPDEIVQRIASGEIMAENATLRMSVRALMAQGGKGESMVRQTFDLRPPQKRAEAMTEIQSYLSSVGDENVLRGARMTQEQAKAAESASYKRLFADGGGEAAPEVSAALSDAFQRVPGVAKEMSAFVRAETKTMPFFDVAADGAVTFTRPPTVQEAEIARRFIAGKKDEAFRAGSPWGETFKTIETAIREPLDVTATGLAATRSNWAKLSTEREAFETGQQLFNRSADEVEILVDDLLRKGAAGEAQLAALRNGAMDALRGKVKGAGGTNLMATLTNPERKESSILRAILPPDTYDDVLQKMGVAAQSQAARGDIIRGPSTALVQSASQRLGTGISPSDITGAISMNPAALLSVGTKLAKAAAPQLSERQRVQLLNVLLSSDPQIVRRALIDESGMMALKQAIDGLAGRIRSGVMGAAAAGGAAGAGETMRQLGGPQ
jgi:hypothetical protein